MLDSGGTISLGAPAGNAEWLRAASRARQLASVSLASLCFEGAATTTAGLLAGSTALVGNGLDGAIEGLASVIVLWRFTGSRTLSPTAERRAQQIVAVSFFLLAPYVAFEASRALLVEHHAKATVLGSAFRSPRSASARDSAERSYASASSWDPPPPSERTGRTSSAHTSPYVSSAVCSPTACLGVWWLDPLVALAISAIAIVEGRRAWRGDACGCATCAPPPGA